MAENIACFSIRSTSEAISHSPEDMDAIYQLTTHLDGDTKQKLIHMAIKKATRWLRDNFERVTILATLLKKRQHLTREEIDGKI